MIFERSTESCAPFFSAPPKKSVQISTTLKVSSTFSKVAGFQRAEPVGRCPQTAKFLLRKRTEQGVRNAKAFRGEAYKTASPCNGTNLLYLQNVPVERFGRKNFLRGFVNYAQTKHLFRQTKQKTPQLSHCDVFCLYLFKGKTISGRTRTQGSCPQ